MHTTTDLHNARVMREAQACHDNAAEPDDDGPLTAAEQAEDECMADGYALAWALQALALADAPIGPTEFAAMHARDWDPSCAHTQELVAVLMMGCRENARLARAELRERIRESEFMRVCIRDRTTEILAADSRWGAI